MLHKGDRGKASLIRARILKLLRSPRIDSKERIPPGCVAWRAGTLYQEQSAFGKMKMDPAKRAQTQHTGEVSSLEWSFPNPLN